MSGSSVERCDRGFIRVMHGQITSDGSRWCVHLAGPDDQSEPWRPYQQGYNADCGWCWLGASHSADAHELAVSR